MSSLIPLSDSDRMFVARYLGNACDVKKTATEMGLTPQMASRIVERLTPEIRARQEEIAKVNGITMERIILGLLSIAEGPPDAKGSKVHNVQAWKELNRIYDGRAPEKKIVAHVNAGVDKAGLAKIRAIVLGVPVERVLDIDDEK